MEFSNIIEFIEHYKDEANTIDLSISVPLVYNILEREKSKLSLAIFPEEKQSVIDFCKESLSELQSRLHNAFFNNSHNAIYKNHVPPFLIDIRMYFEYLSLLTKATHESGTETEKQFSSYDFLDDIRYNEYSDFDIIKKLKEFTLDFDVDLLKGLARDIDVYLFAEKEEMEASYSHDDINNEIERWLQKGLEIPYHRRTKFKDLTEKGKVLALQTHGSEDAWDNQRGMLNLESLLFPFEFYNVYILRAKIKSKIPNVEIWPKVKLKSNDENIVSESHQKLTGKLHALLYLTELYASEGKLPIKDGGYDKKELLRIGKERMPKSKDGQNFYKEVKEINKNFNDDIYLINWFGQDWKARVIELSNNNEVIIKYLSNR